MGPLLLILMLAQPAVAPEAQAPAGEYAWADACKNCHEEIYAAWEKTKHARALSRLSGDERRGDCVQCHVTGPSRELIEDGKTRNANVQCEACHGPGRAHADSAENGAARVQLVKSPAAGACETCHNSRSPRFRGFFYSAMAPLIHRVERR